VAMVEQADGALRARRNRFNPIGDLEAIRAGPGTVATCRVA
jgi:hypothetical protein